MHGEVYIFWYENDQYTKGLNIIKNKGKMANKILQPPLAIIFKTCNILEFYPPLATDGAGAISLSELVLEISMLLVGLAAFLLELGCSHINGLVMVLLLLGLLTGLLLLVIVKLQDLKSYIRWHLSVANKYNEKLFGDLTAQH